MSNLKSNSRKPHIFSWTANTRQPAINILHPIIQHTENKYILFWVLFWVYEALLKYAYYTMSYTWSY